MLQTCQTAIRQSMLGVSSRQPINLTAQVAAETVVPANCPTVATVGGMLQSVKLAVRDDKI
jgi:hypothetical protein